MFCTFITVNYGAAAQDAWTTARPIMSRDEVSWNLEATRDR